ncbi:MAG TPA: nucleoside triphosphate pyrophosphohydrolase [Gammaproteobacteria bacterium]|nr:nucleoside triphosphate pyrophosphohydrolase [Gammaproteobacteria bacterium]
MEGRDRKSIDTLREIMARLRDPEGGCPWDLEQDFASIAPYTLEEAYEVADAIAREAPAALRDELGDLLFQVMFHARMAEERGWFAFPDVVQAINDKMIRRHPHVFGDARVADAREQTRAWEAHKARERASGQDEQVPASVLDDVPLALPALARAQKLQRRAAAAGFDWDALAPVLDKLEEEVAELRQAIETGEGKAREQAELGDVLFSCVNLARFLEADAEQLLRGASARFERRFRRVEALAREAGCDMRDCGLDQLEAWWQQAKREQEGPA